MSGRTMESSIENYNIQYEKRKLGVWLDLSTYCNAKCPQCHRTDWDGLGKAAWLPLIQWSFEEFQSMFPHETLQHIHHFDICGTWGDPIMNKDIFEIIEYIILNSQSTVLINTNGSFRSKNWWEKLGSIGDNRLTVMWAIEGIEQEQHSLYRQDTDLNTILENMEAFTSSGGISHIFTVTFKHNEKDLYNISKLVKDKGASDILFVQSNRFYENNKFRFIDKSGMEKMLEKSTLENSNFYWKSWNLNNDDHMRIIYEESTKHSM